MPIGRGVDDSLLFGTATGLRLRIADLAILSS